jgi:putative oxidoreductase
MKDIFDLVARACLSTIFLFEAYTSIKFFDRTMNTMIEYNITWHPEFLLILTSICLAVGGIFLLIGYRPSFAVILLLCYWVPVTFIVYDFWDSPESTRTITSIMFMKNIAITGGLLHILVHGTGIYSVRRIFGMTRVPKEKW